MTTKLDVARLLDGGTSADVETRHGYARGASVRNGTATGDSSNGWVPVLVDGSTASVAMRADVAVKKGERGTVISQGGTCKFIPVESIDRAAKANAKAIEEAGKALSEAQDDLKELDEKLYGDGTEANPGALKQLDSKLGDLDTALHGEGGLDEKLSGLDDDLDSLNTKLYGDGTEANPGALKQLDADLDAMNAELSGKMGDLDDDLSNLNTELYGEDGKSGKMAELDANLDPDNKDGAMGKAVADAKAALADAATAKETADGKNKVAVQAEQPTGTFAKGDLWRATDDDGNITGEYVWNGSTWVKHVITADALLVKSIVAAAAFIEALQANKLTANEVDAASIVTKAVISAAVKTNKLTANEVDAASIVTKAVISEAVKTNKLTANEVDAASIVTRSLLTSLLEANKITANEIGSEEVTTKHLGAKAVTAEKVDVVELVASEAFIDQFSANTGIIEQIYAAAVVAKEITAAKLKVAGDDSYAEVADGILKLFDANSSSLTELAATYADFCTGKFRIDVGSDYTRMRNDGKFKTMVIDPGGTLEVSSNARIPGITATPNASVRLNLTSSMQIVPMGKGKNGWAGNPAYLAVANSGVVVAASANVSLSGFAMFRGVSAGERCVLALYYGNTQLAYVITTSQGGFCAVSIGPVMHNGGGEGSSVFTLRARTGDGTGFIGYDSDDSTAEAHLTAGLTVSC